MARAKRMTLHVPKMQPIRMRRARKTDLRAQFGALVYRVKNGKTQVLLVTSRGSKRWVVPKGWPMSGKTPPESALQEAWEEAGVKGTPMHQPVGFYSYTKRIRTRGGELPMPVMVSVFPVQARKLSNSFPEAGQRRRKWFSPRKAAARVSEPELARILKRFDPGALR